MFHHLISAGLISSVNIMHVDGAMNHLVSSLGSESPLRRDLPQACGNSPRPPVNSVEWRDLGGERSLERVACTEMTQKSQLTLSRSLDARHSRYFPSVYCQMHSTHIFHPTGWIFYWLATVQNPKQISCKQTLHTTCWLEVHVLTTFQYFKGLKILNVISAPLEDPHRYTNIIKSVLRCLHKESCPELLHWLSQKTTF